MAGDVDAATTDGVGAELAQRLELVGAGGDALSLADGGLPFGRGRGFGGELGLDDVVRGASGLRAVRRGGQGVVIAGLEFVGWIWQQAAARALYGGPPDTVTEHRRWPV